MKSSSPVKEGVVDQEITKIKKEIPLPFKALHSAKDYHHDFLIIGNKDNLQFVIDSLYEENGTIIRIESDSLFSRNLMFDCVYSEKPLTEMDHSIAVPVMHYKFRYKEIKHNDKKITVKEFLRNEDSSYVIKQGVADWDERLYINHQILEKLDGDLPISCPSPILHNWAKPVLLLQNKHKPVFFANSKICVHKFEEVFEGEN
tara:strand:- start:391 stop:996 length:606 start_codon:yes stop_codon:yes gene_type:complete